MQAIAYYWNVGKRFEQFMEEILWENILEKVFLHKIQYLIDYKSYRCQLSLIDYQNR